VDALEVALVSVLEIEGKSRNEAVRVRELGFLRIGLSSMEMDNVDDVGVGVIDVASVDNRRYARGAGDNGCEIYA
jgi:hypothetical protein